MTVRLDLLLLLGVLTAATHWLLARAEITRFLWSRARGKLDRLLRCPSCSGFWIGAGITWGGVHPLVDAPLWKEIVVGALCGIFLTPIFEGVLVWGLRESAIEAPIDDAQTGEIDTTDPTLTESGERTPNERPR